MLKPLAAAVCCLLLAAVAHAQPIIREYLDDSNFEHTTQAATGQTTGVWLVRFCSSTAAPCQQMDGAWEALRQELRQQQVFLAKVDVHATPMLRQRFQITHLPTILLFRDRKMYRYPGKPHVIEDLRQFALEGYAGTQALEVPPLPGAFDWVLKTGRSKLAVIQQALQESDRRALLTALLPAVMMAVVMAGFAVAALRQKEKAD